MGKFDLSDVTFLIPVRIDSGERLKNLKIVLEFLKSNFVTKVKVLEADKTEHVKCQYIDCKFFIVDHDPVFYRTKYLNQLTKSSTTSFVAIWDTDVLLNPHQIIGSVNVLRKIEAEMVFPYDGNFYNTPSIIKNLYEEKKNIAVFSDNKNKFLKVYGQFSVGGAFMVNREAYIDAGMENENFYGWGPEDIERVKRWEILGYNIKWVDGALFHLSHPRKENSWYFDNNAKKKMLKEYLNICRMNKSELTNYLEKFEWIHT